MEHIRRGGGGWRDQTFGKREVRQWHQPYVAKERLHLYGVRGREDLFPQRSDHGVAAWSDVAGTKRAGVRVALCAGEISWERWLPGPRAGRRLRLYHELERLRFNPIWRH